jgi:sterol desaturase/sphingolipid hydroxylase (fatty acid hydroxylase superfamily)
MRASLNETSEFKRLVQWVIYPLLMVTGVVMYLFTLNMGDAYLELATTLPMVYIMLACYFLERYIPYDSSWKPLGQDWKMDTAHLLLFQTLLPKAFKALVLIFALRWIPQEFQLIKGWWPHQAPILLQALMMMFISDFFRYWIHRWSHTLPALWRFHAVHHALKKLYWLNTTRIHPIEKIMQLIVEVGPFICLGVAKEVIALHLVLYGLNGFLRHSNIDMKFGWLNYIFSTNELHRWHHSKLIHESNSNYGSDTMIWDVLFGTFFYPKNQKVGELGLYNAQYPEDLNGQMVAPLVADLDKEDQLPFGWEHWILNVLLRVKMKRNRKRFASELEGDTQHIKEQQEQLLLQLIRKNENTAWGKKHDFSSIVSYQDYQKRVPINTYEELRSWIMEQAESRGGGHLMQEPIVMFNQTSGSTAQPKWIPVTQDTLDGLQYTQQLSTWLQYEYAPEAFEGHIMGIVSPAIENMSPYGLPIGAASGHFYKNMPRLVKRKYVLPHSVFEVKDYSAKYYLILLLALQHKDITYLGSANPSTFLQLNQILNQRKWELLRDLKKGKPMGVAEVIETKLFNRVSELLRPTSQRCAELERLFEQEDIEIKQAWPHLKLLVTWTCGSCGIALKAALKLMPENIKVADLGYLSSEFRGSVAYRFADQSGLPTYQQHFFEFVEKDKWENGVSEFLMLHQLKQNSDYYVFVTTPSGLYRYNMNDILRVTGFVNQCPLIVFQQKGNGACNITGEKLYENQVVDAFQSMNWNAMFYQVLADVEQSKYVGFVEWHSQPESAKEELAAMMDAALRERNVEYDEKRASGRLNGFELRYLPTGTFAEIKGRAVEAGQKEGQFKMVMLQYMDKYKWDLSNAE